MKSVQSVVKVAIVLAFSISTCHFGAPPGARAVELHTLNLEQALKIADEHNRDIEKAREFYNLVRGRYVEERSAALPQLSLNGTANWQLDQSQKAMGGAIPARQDFRSAELELSQALFTWGKVSAAIRVADLGFKTADQRLRIARQDARRDVAAAFYDILLTREQQDIARQNLQQKERHLDEARRKHAAGVATDYDVLAASVSVENARPEVIQSENRVRQAKDRLRFLLALDEEVEVEGSLAADPTPQLSFAEALQTAREKRPELKELRSRLDIAAELVTIANAEDKPRLDLKAGQGWRELDINENKKDGQAWNLGVRLSFPFFDGLKTRGKVAQARSEERSLKIEEAKLVEGISLELRDAMNNVREAGEIVKALEGTVSQADRLLVMAEKGFELGVKIRLEVDDAELNLRQARANLARARRDLLVARINLERIMGVLGEKEPM